MAGLSDFHAEGVTDLTSYRLGQLQERERIIKLLETKPSDLMCCTCGMDEIITLIKGEQK